MAKIKIHYKKGGPSQLPALREGLKAPVNPQESLEAVIAELNAMESIRAVFPSAWFEIKDRLTGFDGDSSRDPPSDLQAFPNFLKKAATSGGSSP